MPFHLFGKRKKYPFNKKKNPPAAVYAGPEYFAQRAGRNDRNGRIYAGPERPDDRDADVEIYAGPEYFEDQLPPKEIGQVFEESDAPLPPEEDESFNTVYAGPEPPEDVEAEGAAGKPGLLVYAGPAFFARRDSKAADDALASGVYAGPEPPRGGMMGMMGMMGGPSPTPPKNEGKAEGEE